MRQAIETREESGIARKARHSQSAVRVGRRPTRDVILLHSMQRRAARPRRGPHPDAVVEQSPSCWSRRGETARDLLDAEYVFMRSEQ